MDEPKVDEPKGYVPKTDDEIKQLVLDMVEGKVCGSWHDSGIEPFLVLKLMDGKALQYFKDQDIVHVYEYLDKAGPMYSNGNPMFMSMRAINRADWARVVPLANQLLAEREAFLKGPVPPPT